MQLIDKKMLKFLIEYEPVFIFGLVVIGVIGNIITFVFFVLTKIK